MIDKKSMNKIIAVATIFVVLFAVFFAYKQYDDYKVLSFKYNTMQKSMEEQRDRFISAILSENQDKASILMNRYAIQIQDEILSEYKDNKKQLEQDITHPSENSKLTQIFDRTLDKVYINVDSNSNRPFVASVNNILWNNSMVLHGKPKNSINWEDFINDHNNKQLSQQAVECIKNMNYNKNNIIFWQPLKTNNSEEKIDSMNMSNLISVYDKYGLESMKPYEILVPAYITNTGDIFNTNDLTNLGYKVPNYKIIIIQRLNVYDILSKYDDDLMYFNSQINKISEEISINEQYKLSTMIGSICALITVLTISGYVQNKLNKKIKKE